MWCFRGEVVDLLSNVLPTKLDFRKEGKKGAREGGGGESSSYPEETE